MYKTDVLSSLFFIILRAVMGIMGIRKFRLYVHTYHSMYLLDSLERNNVLSQYVRWKYIFILLHKISFTKRAKSKNLNLWDSLSIHFIISVQLIWPFKQIDDTSFFFAIYFKYVTICLKKSHTIINQHCDPILKILKELR